MKFRHSLLLFLLIIQVQFTVCFISWLFGSSSEDSKELDEQQVIEVDATQLVRRVPYYEVKSMEERFVAAGKELMARMSELDTCHFSIVTNLKMSCSEVTEEELAKLGVALLNCQSKAEGRRTYTCTESMTIEACTKPMDPDTWNAYHIVSNRARSVCYAVRQQQFQLQTQMAVNQLAMSAEDQLYLMEHLQETQLELNTMTSETLKNIAEGQGELLGQQEEMKSSQSKVQERMQDNLKDLTSEKALIAAGHKELADMTNDIRLQLDNATHQLLSQDLDRKKNHHKVLKDLSTIQNKARAVWDKLDSNFQDVLSHHNETNEQYKETLENLKKMNATITYMLEGMNEMQGEIDRQLNWVTTLLGSAGENVEALKVCIFHASYFVLAALLLSFLCAPTVSRLLTIFLIPLNALSEIQHGRSLDYSSLTVLIGAIVVVNMLYVLYQRNIKGGDSGPKPSPLTPTAPCSCGGAPALTLSPIQGSIMKKHNSTLDDSDYTLDSMMSSDLTSMGSNETTSTAYASTILKHRSLSNTVDTLGGRDSVDISNDRSTIKMPKVSEQTPMPEENTTYHGGLFGFPVDGNPAKRHLGSVLEKVNSSPVTKSPRRKKEGTPVSTPSSSPSRRLCQGLTKTGQSCRLTCSKGSYFCHRHH